MRKTRIIVVVLVLSLTGLALCLWLIPYATWLWDAMTFRPDHFAGILSHDVCFSTGNTNDPAIVLPKGMSVFSPEGNDYGVTAPDDTTLYKVYIHLTPETIDRMTKFSRHGHTESPFTNQTYNILEETDRTP